MKYRLLRDINYFPDWIEGTDIKWYDRNLYKKGDIIVFNEWIGKYGKLDDPYSTYKFRMFSQEFIDGHPELFENII